MIIPLLHCLVIYKLIQLFKNKVNLTPERFDCGISFGIYGSRQHSEVRADRRSSSSSSRGNFEALFRIEIHLFPFRPKTYSFPPDISRIWMCICLCLYIYLLESALPAQLFDMSVRRSFRQEYWQGGPDKVGRISAMAFLSVLLLANKCVSSLQLKADRPHPRYYPCTPPDDKRLRLVITLIGLAALGCESTNTLTDRRMDGQSDTSKCIISLASWSIKTAFYGSMFMFYALIACGHSPPPQP